MGIERSERTHTAAIACAAATACLFAPRALRAQSEYGAHARIEPKEIERAGEDATGAATRVQLTDRPAPLETITDVIAEIPGARALASGGHGSFASVSLRGNEPSHTTWLLGEAPLNDPEAGRFDVSLLPLPYFERIEVYRGGAPLWFSQGAIAGAVRLVPRDDPGTGGEARAGLGSHGLRHAQLTGHVRPARAPGLAWFTAAHVSHADNDYPYLDDRDSRFDASDDLELPLRNAQVTDGAGLSHLRAPIAGGELDVVAFGVRRLGGAPGGAGLGANALQTRRAILLGTLAAAYTRRGDVRGGHRYRLQLASSGRVYSTQLRDPVGELGSGGPSATSDTRLHGFARLAAAHELTGFLEASAVGTYSHADGERSDALRRSPLGAFGRSTAAGALELRVFGAPFALPSELRVSTRLEITRVDADVYERARARHDSEDQGGHAHRAAFASELSPFLQVRGSVGTGTRPPAAEELFGDGGSLRPNTQLVPERGLYADAGAVLTHAGEPVAASAELTGFVQDVDDKIIFDRTNQSEAIAKNIGSARIRGVESGVDVELRGGGPRLVASATLLSTESHLGRSLPSRPKLRVHGSIEQSARFAAPWPERVTGFAEIDHEASSFYDQANLELREPLTRVGCGLLLSFARERIELAARVSDVFDARGQDYLEFPLPGRTVFFLLTIRETTP